MRASSSVGCSCLGAWRVGNWRGIDVAALMAHIGVRCDRCSPMGGSWSAHADPFSLSCDDSGTRS